MSLLWGQSLPRSLMIAVDTDLVRVTPVWEVYTIQALAKPGVALRIICIPGYVHIALDVEGRQGEQLQQTQGSSQHSKKRNTEQPLP